MERCKELWIGQPSPVHESVRKESEKLWARVKLHPELVSWAD